MQTSRHPDLEIYLKNSTNSQILAWLQTHCSTVLVLRETPSSLELELQFEAGLVQASLQHKVSGKAWSSLWFKDNQTPWDTDLDCALIASQQLQTQIRCTKASWEDDGIDREEEDQWWKIEDGERVLISWKG
ncbi:MAG: hypothetical protein OFPII_37520 [Osedax symbiont Rs1]|nr:MAG: hypothetical protein OFPII_37520 [Osedax symbiont Rs1]